MSFAASVNPIAVNTTARAPMFLRKNQVRLVLKNAWLTLLLKSYPGKYFSRGSIASVSSRSSEDGGRGAEAEEESIE